jgi:hypothetical protein
MLRKATCLAVSGLFLSLFTAMPAAAQSADAAAPPPCARTISEQSGDIAESARAPAAAPGCSAPRGRAMNGGRLAHAIMLVRDGLPVADEIPRPAALLVPLRRLSFTRPVER